MFFRNKPLEFSISLAGTNVGEVINKILFIAEKCKNPQLRGLCFLIKENCDFEVIVSDTFRLAVISFPNAIKNSDGKCDFFIALDQLPSFIIRLQSEGVSFSVSEREIAFQDGLKIKCLRNSRVSSYLSSYETLIPKPEKYRLYISREEVERFQNPVDRNCLQFPLAGVSPKIVVNREYFLDAFRILGDRLTVSIKEIRGPILIKGENKNTIYLLMPIAQ